ncbi:MAG: hypothetical protein A4S09_02140 [Proteobacteria bacterium SG_bin7]|nr:MAG: hypothetical protein A4S09_02140 [Proteobacteria bacterium SG_bin7]
MNFKRRFYGLLNQSLPGKKSVPQWRIQYTSFKKADWSENTKAKVPKKEWNIPKDRWHALGFNKFMNLEEAKARAKQLNAQAHIKRQEERSKNCKRAVENSDKIRLRFAGGICCGV